MSELIFQALDVGQVVSRAGLFAIVIGGIIRIAFFIIGLIALYFIIKMATKRALKEHYEEREIKERRPQQSA